MYVTSCVAVTHEMKETLPSSLMKPNAVDSPPTSMQPLKHHNNDYMLRDATRFIAGYLDENSQQTTEHYASLEDVSPDDSSHSSLQCVQCKTILAYTVY